MTEIQDNAVKAENTSAPAPHSAIPVVPVAIDAKYTEAESFGRIDDKGDVFVKDGDTERQIGNYPDQLPAQPLQIFVRRYLDLVAQIDLFEARLGKITPKEINSTIASLAEQVKLPAAIGDLPKLRQRVEKLQNTAEQRIEEFLKERAAAKEQATKDRTAVIEEAEKIAAQDPQKTQWKQSGQKIQSLLEEWKRLQHSGPRIDRNIEDALWKRFSAARTAFEKARRQFFNELEATQAQAKRAKEMIIIEAEKLSSSTDWGATAAAFRNLMNHWKQAGRAGRKVDDQLWERFHAAQQKFFEARKAQNEVADAQMAENLKAKLELLEKAEALLPIKNLEEAKASLRSIQEAWENIGYVPRDDMPKVEGRMRAVEDAIRNLEEDEWQRTNPEKQARAAGMAGQLQALIDELKEEIKEAEANQDANKVKELQEALKAREAWLAQVNAF